MIVFLIGLTAVISILFDIGGCVITILRFLYIITKHPSKAISIVEIFLLSFTENKKSNYFN